MNIPITMADILFAAFAAGIVLFIVRVMSQLFRSLTNRSTIFILGNTPLDPSKLEDITQKCYNLFPIESFKWEGSTFTRGTNLRMITSTNSTFQGKFIGVNSDDIVCLLTDQCVIAQEINTILSIQEL